MKKLFYIIALILAVGYFVPSANAQTLTPPTSPTGQHAQATPGPDGFTPTSYTCAPDSSTGGCITVNGNTFCGTNNSSGTGGGTNPAQATTNSSNCPNGGTCDLGYTPLEPIPGVTSGTNLTTAAGFATLVNAIFTILISAGALIAVLSLTIGGIQYMTASSVGNKTQGIDRARAAMYGILLIAATYLILNTINPHLLNFDFIACPGGSASCGTAANVNPTNNTSGSSVNLQSTTALGPATLGTATGDQMRQVNSELGLSGSVLGSGVASDKVLIYDPTNNSSANNAAINSFTSFCETSSHYSVQPVYGGTFNAPGQNALVCVSN